MQVGLVIRPTAAEMTALQFQAGAPIPFYRELLLRTALYDKLEEQLSTALQRTVDRRRPRI